MLSNNAFNHDSKDGINNDFNNYFNNDFNNDSDNDFNTWLGLAGIIFIRTKLGVGVVL